MRRCETDTGTQQRRQDINIRIVTLAALVRVIDVIIVISSYKAVKLKYIQLNQSLNHQDLSTLFATLCSVSEPL